ncbi:glycosylphosphatidylinositol anchor biosynthesis [Friedmanniomyces endolithicus]|nr:glycosylphosphatidylinositol anchor biosynthesis [Friedmanniomyces endolithicus]
MPPPYEIHNTSQSSLASSIQSGRHYVLQDLTRLRPEDAIYGPAPPRSRPRKSSPLGRSDTVTTATAAHPPNAHKSHRTRRGRSADRRRKTTWKKLLWVKQSYPDNYTDEETFLDHLQRNPRLRPYEFWPLVADSTIIVQHVCSVVIFVCCFTGIFQERVSPQTVVGWATVGTVGGWVLRDWWQGKEEVERAAMLQDGAFGGNDAISNTSSSGPGSATAVTEPATPIAEASSTIRRLSGAGLPDTHSRNPSATSVTSTQPNASFVATSEMNAMPGAASGVQPFTSTSHITPYGSTALTFSPRTQERLTTAKSALLIYCSLLGLSPILKSLTRSTSSDSIWALSFWLMILNVFTFDYGAGPEVKFPASLSTNAALMASTVLASRLPNTTHVFSLTLFSIEVFGLFPVFRRHLRHQSWTGHLWLTTSLVIMAGTGLSLVISGGGWGFGILGAVLGALATGMSMGMTSWWLIGLQRYKNEIRGPWDPARPVIRRGWD